jgi:RES domain-containing protein
MILYRARAWRTARDELFRFEPLYSEGSIRGKGWRWNDRHTEVLYMAERESLAILEVAVRPKWDTVKTVMVAHVDFGDRTIATLDELAIALPPGWDARPAGDAQRDIAWRALAALATLPPATRPIGVRVPSVLSSTDYNVLVDPANKEHVRNIVFTEVPFANLLNNPT